MQTIENSNYTVLVVDDDDDFNSTLRTALSDVGFNVLTTNSGSKGLKILQYGNENVDVVLLDYSMPVLDGAQTLEHMREKFPTLKAIGVTGLGTSQLSEAYRNGVGQLLLKPIKISDLVTAIQSVLGIPVTTKSATRTAYWIKFGVWYVLMVLCCYGFLRLLGLAVNQALSSN